MGSEDELNTKNFDGPSPIKLPNSTKNPQSSCQSPVENPLLIKKDLSLESMTRYVLAFTPGSSNERSKLSILNVHTYFNL